MRHREDNENGDCGEVWKRFRIDIFCVVEFPHGLSKIHGSPHVHKFRKSMSFRWRISIKRSYRVSGLETMSITRWLTNEKSFMRVMWSGKSWVEHCILAFLICLFVSLPLLRCAIFIYLVLLSVAHPIQTHCRCFLEVFWKSYNVN